MLDDDWDMLEFATAAQDLSGGKVEFETIPVADLNGMTDDGESMVEVNPKDVQKYVAGLVGEEPTDRSEEHHHAPETPDIDASTVTVDVAMQATSGASRTASPTLSRRSATARARSATTQVSWAVSETTVFAHSAERRQRQGGRRSTRRTPHRTDTTLPEGSVRVVLSSTTRARRPPRTTGTTTSSESSETGLQPASTAGTTPTPAPPGRAHHVGSSGPRRVN